MKRRRAAAASTAVLGAFALVVAAGATPALAHTHPTPVELDAPAVVQVRTEAVVDIGLIEHHRKRGADPHIELFRRQYVIPLSTQSGFAVDPTGAVVTTNRAVNVSEEPAKIAAVNRIFKERYGGLASVPADEFSRGAIADGVNDLAGDALNPRLQKCYDFNQADESGACVIATNVRYRVMPFVTDQAMFGNLSAEVLYPPKGTPSDVAVLRVGASSMPAVQLASRLAGSAYAVLGFRQDTAPGDPATQVKVDGHFKVVGAPEVRPVDIDKDSVTGKETDHLALQRDAVVNGVQGGPVVGETGQVLGFMQVDAGSSQAGLTLVGADQIRKALNAVNIVPGQGPTDTVFEAASHDFKNGLNKAALPNLAETLKLYPGHAIASANQAFAMTHPDKPQDPAGTGSGALSSTSASSNTGGLVPLLVAVGLLVLLGLALILLRRRNQRQVAAVPESSPSAAAQAPEEPRTYAAAASAAMLAAQLPERAAAPGRSAEPQAAPTTPRSGAGDRRPSRAREAATNAGPVVGSPGFVKDRPRPVASDTKACRVCGHAASAQAEYCDGCGYPPA